jgi:hypothetical protein
MAGGPASASLVGMFRSPLALALLGGLALSASAPAATMPTTDYAVTIEGTASYNRADVDGDVSAQHDIDVAFRTEIPKLTFHGDAAEDSRGALGTGSLTRGSYVITGESGQLRCATHTLDSADGGGLDATRGATATTFATRVAGPMAISVGDCGPMPNWSLVLGATDDPVGVGMFDGTFTFPHSLIGQGSLSFPLQGEVTGSSCPFHHFNTALCSLTWQATVRFTRTGTGSVEGEDDLVVPLGPAPAPAPAPPPAAAPAPADAAPGPLTTPVAPAGRNLVKPVLAKASLARNLSRASLPLACAATCRGTVTATVGKRRLARTSFRASAGHTATARLRFDAADRRAIRRAGFVRLVVRATAGGRTARATTTLRRG